MKTNNYLWSMLVTATFVLTGCGSDEDGITPPYHKERQRNWNCV